MRAPLSIRRSTLSLLVVALSVVAATAAPAADSPRLPVTPRRPVTDVYQGQSVVDDYRWLEDYHDPSVRAWSDSQNVVARDWLDHAPGRADILARVTALNKDLTPAYFGMTVRGGVTFALKSQPPLQQPRLVALPSVDDLSSERIVVDPNTIDATGGDDDRLLRAVARRQARRGLALRRRHRGRHRLRVRRGHGAELSDEIPRVNGGTAGGAVEWNADGTGLYHTRYPAKGERPDEDLAILPAGLVPPARHDPRARTRTSSARSSRASRRSA